MIIGIWSAGNRDVSWGLIFLLLVILLFSCVDNGPDDSSSLEVFRITEGENRALLDDALFAFKDENNEFAFREVKSEEESLFKPADQLPGNLVMGDNPYWIRVTFTDLTEKDWSVRLSEPRIDFIHVFLPDPEAPERIKRISYSTKHPFPGQDSSHRWFRFPLDLDFGETKTYYLHLDQPPLAKFTLWETQKLDHYEYTYSLILGGFFGLLLAIGIYALYLFFSLNDRSYLYFTGMIVGLLSFLTYYRTFSFLFFPSPQGNWGIVPSLMLGNFGVIATYLFLRNFLNLKTFSPFLYKAAVPLIIGTAVFFVPFLVSEREFTMWSVLSTITLVMAVYFIAAVVVAVKNRFKPAWYLIAGMGSLIGVILITGIYNMGFTDFGVILDFDITAIGATSLLVIFFSMALANRYRLIMEEREKAVTEKRMAEEENLQKTEFFINLAHEIKTPLTVISNYVEEYIRGKGETGEEAQDLSILRRNVMKLKRDMVNFFDLLRFEKGKIVYNHDQGTAFSEALETACSVMRETLSRKGISCSSSIAREIYLQADPMAADRIINNLLDNALRYTPGGGRIEVELSPLESFPENRVLFTVTNSCEEIPKEKLESLFLPYYQLSRKKRSDQGIGLGLSIVKSLVEEVGGSIEAEVPQRGLISFSVSLPVYNPQGKSEKPTLPGEGKALSEDSDFLFRESPSLLEDRASDGKTTGKKVLLVEDNLDLLELLRRRLSEKYIISTAKDGREAYELLKKGEEKPDVLITDIMMDRMDGYELIDAIQRMEQTKTVPIIILTAKSGEEDKRMGYRAGAVDFISKPFSMEELELKIESLLLYADVNAAFHEKKKFLAMGMLTGEIAHELFNPLNIIYAPLDNLKRIVADLEGKDSEGLNKYIQDIETSLERIESIVRTVRTLHLNKLFEKKKILLYDTIQDSISRVKGVYNKRVTYRLDVAEDAVVFADLPALEQVLYNLLKNSTEAVEEGGIIRVYADHGSTGEVINSISIEDNGRGIDEEIQDRLFTSEMSVFSSSRGMGLGLYITAEIVKRLGWTISLDSSFQEGTRFIIRTER